MAAVASAARAGRSQTVVLCGPPGQGKTALLNQLAVDAGDLRVLRATGIESEAELPYGLLHSLLRPLLRHLPSLPDVQAEALRGALALGPGVAVERFAVGSATISLLAAAAEERPLLCLIDDLQWVDDASRQALLFAARRLDSEAVGVVLAVRTEGESPAELRGLEVCKLGPIAADDARSILSDLSNDRLPREAADQLVAAAAGNPLTLMELARRLTAAELEGREALIGPPAPNISAQALLAERHMRLSERARQALLVAAASEDQELGLLERALAAADMTLADLNEIEEAQLAEMRPGRLIWHHPLIRSVAYHGSPPEARRAAHRAVAAALPRDDPRGPWHLAAATAAPDESVAAALEESATEAGRRGGYASAARARRRSADLTPDLERKAERLIRAADDYELAGLYGEAQATLTEAARFTREVAVIARIEGVQASLLSRMGRSREARERLLDQAGALTTARPLTAARFYLQASFASMLLDEVEPWERHARAALTLLDDASSPTHRVARAQLATALVGAGRLSEADALIGDVLAELDAQAAEPLRGAVEVYAALAQGLIWVERWMSAEQLLRRLVDDARSTASISALPYLLGMQSLLESRLGRWPAAAALAAEAIALGEQTHSQLFVHTARAVDAVVAAWRGEEVHCIGAAERELVADAAFPQQVVWPHFALGALALGRGDVPKALEHYQAVVAAERGHALEEPGARPWVPDLIECLIRANQIAAAEQWLTTWEAVAQRTERRFALATAERCRGLLAPEDQIDACFSRALEHHDTLSMPLERARTLLCWGERLRRVRRRADARQSIRDALETLERLGAKDWAKRARTELRATGGKPAAPLRPELEGLTPHEVQVALMVANGQTNKEVAAALFLAPKTIEHHLSTIFRKLDIKRRTELARVFADELAGRSS